MHLNLLFLEPRVQHLRHIETFSSDLNSVQRWKRQVSDIIKEVDALGASTYP